MPDLNAWIGDAIRFYSNEFPRLIRHSLTLVTGTQVYALPADSGSWWVLYPAGEAHLRRSWWRDVGVRDGISGGWAGVRRAGRGRDDTHGIELIFAEPVSTGETAIVSYSGAHWIPTADEESTSVPELHTEALIAFVRLRAHAQLEAIEAVDMANVSIILSQLGQRRAWPGGGTKRSWSACRP